MDPVIRTVTVEDLPDFVRALNASMFQRLDPDPIAAELASNWELGRVWAAFDGPRLVATFRTFDTDLTVPGCDRLPATALSSVTVTPDYRRRGILRRMIAAEHATARERGEAVGLLYAAEYPIYGRFGYGPACREATWSIDTRAADFLGQPSGTVELIRADETVRDASIAVFDAWRARRPGEIRRLAYRWDYQFGLRASVDETWNGMIAVHRDAGGVIDGYVRYEVEEKWEQRQPCSTVTVEDLHAVDSVVEGELWRFLAGIDWVASVVANRRVPSDPMPWRLRNARAAHVTESGDGLWVRLLDVGRALEARTYERSGSVVLEIVDGEAAGGRVRLALDAGPDGTTCRPSTASPDLTLDVDALGAAYLGGTSLKQAVLQRGSEEHRPGALDLADALFRTLEEPWCSTFF